MQAHSRNREAYNRHGGYVECDDDPLWHAYERTMREIDDAQPSTIEGVIAKARVAIGEATDLDGELMHEGTIGSRWAFEVLEDLLRLTGAA